MADEQITDPADLDNRQGSADVGADDERKKFIAQAGENPLAQERAQDVPQPVSNEAKDLQNDLAEAEHQAKGADNEDEKVDRLKAAADRLQNQQEPDLNDDVRKATDKAHEDQQKS